MMPLNRLILNPETYLFDKDLAQSKKRFGNLKKKNSSAIICQTVQNWYPLSEVAHVRSGNFNKRLTPIKIEPAGYCLPNQFLKAYPLSKP